MIYILCYNNMYYNIVLLQHFGQLRFGISIFLSVNIRDALHIS